MKTLFFLIIAAMTVTAQQDRTDCEQIAPRQRSTGGTITMGTILIGATTGAEYGGRIGSQAGGVAQEVVRADADRQRTQAQAYEACVQARAWETQAIEQARADKARADAQIQAETARTKAEVEIANINAGTERARIDSEERRHNTTTAADLIKSGAGGSASAQNGVVASRPVNSVAHVTVDGKVYNVRFGN